MSDQGQTPSDDVAAVRAPAVPADTAGGDGSSSIAASLPVGSELAQERPEVLVGAAFVVGFLAGRILKHLTASE